MVGTLHLASRKGEAAAVVRAKQLEDFLIIPKILTSCFALTRTGAVRYFAPTRHRCSQPLRPYGYPSRDEHSP